MCVSEEWKSRRVEIKEIKRQTKGCTLPHEQTQSCLSNHSYMHNTNTHNHSTIAYIFILKHIHKHTQIRTHNRARAYLPAHPLFDRETTFCSVNLRFEWRERGKTRSHGISKRIRLNRRILAVNSLLSIVSV